MSEANEENPEHFVSFNDFFIRQLKPSCRPLAQAGLISPVDGCVSEIGAIHSGMLLQAKNRYYSVADLLACEPELSSQFENGCFTTLYLSPKDYHRVHMPMQGILSEMIHVPGKLFSVQPLTTRMIPQLFSPLQTASSQLIAILSKLQSRRSMMRRSSSLCRSLSQHKTCSTHMMLMQQTSTMQSSSILSHSSRQEWQ